MLPSKLTVPLTLPLFVRVKLLVSTVVAKMSSPKVAVITLFVAMPVADAVGDTLLTVGGVVSALVVVPPPPPLPPPQATNETIAKAKIKNRLNKRMAYPLYSEFLNLEI